MSSIKLVNNKRRNHASKVLQQMSKNLGPEHVEGVEATGSTSRKATPEAELKSQYELIRKDLIKLRNDLQHGYDLARNYFETMEPKTLVKGFLKAK